ncbi:MAG: dihydrolipoamide acetyltransferase family protein, partial [Nitrososphaerota archaeon]
MAVDVLMPEISEGVSEGNIVEWLRKDGEYINEGEPLLIVETQKVTFEIASPASGKVRILKPQGSTVKVSERIAVIEEVKGEAVKAVAREKEEVTEAAKPEVEKTVERVRASPRAKRLARELQIDLTTIKGTGPNGLITEDDVRAVIEAKAPARLEELEEVIPLTGWRKTMAEKMAESKRTAAHITTFAEVDVTELVSLREKLLPVVEEKAGLKLTYTPFIIKAVAQALLEYPIVNSSLIGDKIVVKKYCNIGVAMAREKGGLIVPVIHHAEKLNLIEIAKKLEELTQKARDEKLTLEDVRGGTFTITNVG